MNTSKNMYKDVMTGLLFMAGILSFISGDFVFSTLLFGTAALTSNLNIVSPVRV